MKKRLYKIIIIIMCLITMTSVLKPKKVEAIGLTAGLASVTALALVGVLGYNLVMPKDKQIDVSGQLTGLFNKAKEWADGLPDWLYYSEADFESDLGSPTGVGTLSKDNLRGVSSMIKDYLGSRESFYLDSDLNIVDSSNILNSSANNLWILANGIANTSNNRIHLLSNYFTSGQTPNNSPLDWFNRFHTSTKINELQYPKWSVIDSSANIPNSFTSITNQYIISNIPDNITMSSLNFTNTSVAIYQASLFDEVIGQKAFAGYDYDQNGYITYKYQTIDENDMVLFESWQGISVNVRNYPESVLGIYEHYGTSIRYFNVEHSAYRTLSLPIDVGINALFTIRSLQEYVLNHANTAPNSIRYEKNHDNQR